MMIATRPDLNGFPDTRTPETIKRQEEAAPQRSAAYYRKPKRAKIISLGTAVPKTFVTQKEAYDALGYTSQRVWNIFKNSGIDRRPCWIHPSKLRNMTFEQMCQEYEAGAVNLGLEAALQCIEGLEIRKDIGSITFATTTQPRLLCPSLSYFYSMLLKLPSDIEHTDMIGGGCVGGAPAIRRAHDHFMQTGYPALVITAEICTATFYPAPEKDLENTVANAIFSDGACACLIGQDDNPKHPWIWAFAEEFDRRYIDYLGFDWVDGRLKVKLDKDVPKVAPVLVERVVNRILEQVPGMTLRDIKHLIIHPGGVKVLDNIRDRLKIPEEKLAYSRQILRQQGNQSSATIASIGRLAKEQAQPGDWGLVLTMGAGFKTYGILLYWA
jgi:predicted naringenin-chalcone synthase